MNTLISSAQLSRLLPALLFTSLLALAVTACGDANEEEETPAICGGHGTFHNDHCDCDDGYVSTDDLQSCVPRTGDEENNHDHNNHDHNNENNHDHNNENNHDHNNENNHAHEGGELSFNPSETFAFTATGDDGEPLWILEAADGETYLTVELYASFGGPTAAGVYPITEAEADYATCGLCLVLRHEDALFMPEAGGEVELTTLGATAGEQLAGELRGITFREVTIREADYVTTPVEGGVELTLESWSFEVTLSEEPGHDECSGHGHLHGDTCHCDEGYVVDPNDPGACIAE